MFGPFLLRWAAAILLLLLAPALTYAVTKRLRAQPGLPRLICAAPALAALFSAPFLFDVRAEFLSRMAVAYFSERLPATKVRLTFGVCCSPYHGTAMACAS